MSQIGNEEIEKVITFIEIIIYIHCDVHKLNNLDTSLRRPKKRETGDFILCSFVKMKMALTA